MNENKIIDFNTAKNKTTGKLNNNQISNISKINTQKNNKLSNDNDIVKENNKRIQSKESFSEEKENKNKNENRNEKENHNNNKDKNVADNKINDNINININKTEKSKDDSNIINLNSDDNKKLKKKYVKELKRQEKEFNAKVEKSKEKIKKDEREVSIGLNSEYNSNVKKKKETSSSLFDILIYVFSFIILLIIIINLPVFKVEDISLAGNYQISKDEIKKLINIEENNNFLFLYLKHLEQEILKNPMIKDVKVKYTFPNQIAIKIEERTITGYIPYLDCYVYIDSTGKVVNINDSIIPDIPLIVGLDFTSFTFGEILDVTNQDSLDVIVELSNIMNKYMTNTEITSIDITNLDNIRILSGKIEIIIGNMDDCDLKLRKAIEILKQLPNSAGYLDISNSNSRSIFTPK